MVGSPTPVELQDRFILEANRVSKVTYELIIINSRNKNAPSLSQNMLGNRLLPPRMGLPPPPPLVLLPVRSVRPERALRCPVLDAPSLVRGLLVVVRGVSGCCCSASQGATTFRPCLAFPPRTTGAGVGASGDNTVTRGYGIPPVVVALPPPPPPPRSLLLVGEPRDP